MVFVFTNHTFQHGVHRVRVDLSKPESVRVLRGLSGNAAFSLFTIAFIFIKKGDLLLSIIVFFTESGISDICYFRCVILNPYNCSYTAMEAWQFLKLISNYPSPIH